MISMLFIFAQVEFWKNAPGAARDGVLTAFRDAGEGGQRRRGGADTASASFRGGAGRVAC
ncbi:MAG: hypothetical protein B7Y95_04520 [Rhizobiales bacterium 32-66-11]|nr:MAG: hypothetical protein B7Y95_04520 [Rhizobiales bacterium 32-66-11]